MKTPIFALSLFSLLVAVGDGHGQPLDRMTPDALLSHYIETREGREEVIAKGTTMTPLLRRRLADERPEVRRTALDLLGQLDVQHDGVLNQDETIHAMVETIDGSEPDAAVIDKALRHLQRMDPQKATLPLKKALLTQLEHGHAKAARVLGRLGDPALSPELERHAKSSDEAVAELSKQALAKLGSEQYLAGILAELHTDDVRVRSEAFRKLVYVQSAATVREIAAFLNDSGPLASNEPHVRYTPYRFLAAWALGQIVGNPPVKKDLAALYTQQDVETWKTWWELSQRTYPLLRILVKMLRGSGECDHAPTRGSVIHQ